MDSNKNTSTNIEQGTDFSHRRHPAPLFIVGSVFLIACLGIFFFTGVSSNGEQSKEAPRQEIGSATGEKSIEPTMLEDMNKNLLRLNENIQILNERIERLSTAQLSSQPEPPAVAPSAAEPEAPAAKPEASTAEPAK